MRKFLFALGFISVFSPAVFGAVRTPKDNKGDTLPTIDWIGAKTCRLGATASINPIGCSTGTAIVYGVVFSSVGATNFVVFRDSATANITSSTAAVVFANGTQANASGASTTLMMKFPVPLQFDNGVSVNMGSALGQISEVQVIYRSRSLATTAAE